MKADDSYIEPDSGDLARLLATVRQIAATASARILSVYETDFAVEHKDDRSPLTEADMQAHRAIVSGLRELTPGWPILSEESASVDFSERQTWQRYWLVDPLDGTREFVKRNGEFTVNIALIADHQPILGVVQVPVTGVCYFAARGIGACKFVPEYGETRISTRSAVASRLAIAGSRSHGSERFQTFMENLDGAEVVTIGSSLKSCLVAEGLIDLYPRFGPTSEWDTAAAHCVVEQAGGEITDMAFQPLRYNCKDSLLNPNFLVIGDPAFDWRSYLPVE
ncbi:MAG: 3'(2'),5'-bisphosphate nucleotidase CysQ [Gammaproteobacteria bacterium]